MKKNEYKKNREKVLKTKIGKKTYKKLTISTIFLMFSLFGISVIMTCFCKYCLNGGNWNDLHLASTLFPLFSTIAFITGATTCFFAGEYNILIKTHKK